MATQVQLRGGTTTEHSTFTGAVREVTVDTDKDVLVVHDGSTAGGKPMLGSGGGTLTGNLSLGDSVKAKFGASDDLQIYHDGDNSYIKDAGTGNLHIQGGANIIFEKTGGEDMLTLANDGSVILKYNGVDRVETTSAGIDVTGTVTADGLTVDGSGKISSATPILRLSETDTANVNSVIKNAGGDFYIQTENDAEDTRTSRFSVDHATGDISFYDSTGNTPKFHWDAADERLGIGTGSPVSTLTLPNDGMISWASTACNIQATSSGADYIKFTTNSSEAMRIDSSGNVGIGVTSPSSQVRLDVKTADSGYVLLARAQTDGVNDGDTTVKVVKAVNNAGGNWSVAHYDADSHKFVIKNATTAMTIANDGDVTVDTGNLVIGTSGKGIDFSANGHADGMTSELLDDYETGTFDVTLLCDGNSATRACRYTKIGNMVTVDFAYTGTTTTYWNISGSSGDAVTITSSLPFTPMVNGGFACSVTRSLGNGNDLCVGWGSNSATLYLGTADQNQYMPNNNAAKDSSQSYVVIQGSGTFMVA